MAEINFQSYKTAPYFLHHNFDDFYNQFIENHIRIQDKGIEYLNKSIERQKEREQPVFDAFGLDRNQWQQIGNKLLGTNKIDEKEENRVEFFLKNFMKIIEQNMIDEVDVGTLGGDYLKAENKDEFIKDNQKKIKLINETVNKFIAVYNDPVLFLKKEFEKHNLLKDQYTEQLEDIALIFKNSRKNKKGIIEGDESLIQSAEQMGLTNALDFLNTRAGILGNLTGNVGEEVITNFIEENTYNIIKDGIEKKYSISGAQGTSALGIDDNERKRMLESNKNYYTNLQGEIGTGLKNSGIALKYHADGVTADENFEFGLTYSEKQTNTLIKNLKADEVFSLEISFKKNDIINTRKEFYGISTKTSYTKNKELKIYSGSFLGSLENLFKSNLIDYGDIGEIVNFLIYSIFNGYGSGTYGSYKKIEENGKISYNKIEDTNLKERNILNKNKFYQGYEVQNLRHEFILPGKGPFVNEEAIQLYNILINATAYQWFTGGDSPDTHADFFSVYSKDNFNFVPMSIILEAVQSKIKSKNKLLTQDFLSLLNYSPTPIKEKDKNGKERIVGYEEKSSNPLSLNDYMTTWDYGSMYGLACDTLNKKGTRSIKTNKETLFKAIKGLKL